MRTIKLTFAIGIVPLDKLQQNVFNYKCIINDKKKINRGTITGFTCIPVKHIHEIGDTVRE